MDTRNDVLVQQAGVEWPQYSCHELLEKQQQQQQSLNLFHH